jgi:DNA repair photolyase
MTEEPTVHGRGSSLRPPNRFGQMHAQSDLEQVALDAEYLAALERVPTQYLPDASRSIVSENDSPDIPFRYSINPYRGCQHGCAYCYARPTHEYLGLNAGIDFESRIFVKHRAAELFRDWLNRPGYVPEPVMMSGVTDCYQPAEREYRLTRGLLEVALEARQPIGIVTKNALVTRDLDLLAEMTRLRLVGVAVSVTTLDPVLARVMEPRTSQPSARLRALQELSAAGIPTRVMVAPIIPGLNDMELPEILAAAASAGAQSAGYVLLRLPLTVRPVFEEWLERTQPDKAEKVLSLIRSTRDGEMYDAQFGSRMRGTGIIAGQIEQMFRIFRARHGLDRPSTPLDASQFRPPRSSSGQLRLF